MFVFFNETATTEIYTLSLHDALPIYDSGARRRGGRGHLSEPRLPDLRVRHQFRRRRARAHPAPRGQDRKSTRLNSSHITSSYAVFRLKQKTSVNISPSFDSPRYY